VSLRPPVAIPENARDWFRWMRETYDMGVLSGNGTPEGNVKAEIGTLYRRRDGGANTTLYVKESGNGTANGWVAK